MCNDIKVSIVIPTFKRAEFLDRAIDSVLNQTYNNLEVIIVDDNNPETEYRKKTELTMFKYNGDPRVKYIKHNKNRNGSAARNTGINHSNGKYICFLDDDDYYFPQKVEKQLDYLIKHPEYKATYCGWQVENKTIIPIRSGNLMYEQFMGSNIIDTNMIMMEKSAIEEFGGWDERLKRNQDVAFIIKYFNKGYKIGLVKEALVNIDLVDRSNVANPYDNEKNFNQFFQFYNEEIFSLKKTHKNAKKNIYSSRYRGVLFNYIKNKKFHGAFKVYFKMMKVAPLTFNGYLLSGLIKKVNNKPLYSYEK
jgi:glycosyltransferase involved in cell wall biosynthesis